MRKVEIVGLISRCCIFVFVIFMISTIGSKAFALERNNWTGNINVSLGFKTLEEDDWAPADEHSEFGIEVDFKQQSWPVSIAIDYLRSSGDGTFAGVEFEGETSELNIGIRKILEQSPQVRPFIGGGISFIRGEFSGLGISDDDTGVGGWLGGGIYWTLAEQFNIGLQLKYSFADVTLFGVDVSAGGLHYGALLGYHW